MKKKYVKRLAPFVLCFALLLALFPGRSFAAGTTFNGLGSNAHWGSDPFSTSYPALILSVHQTFGGTCTYKVQVLYQGNWVDDGDVAPVTLYGNQAVHDFNFDAYSSTNQYRIFAQTPTSNTTPVYGYVSGAGSNY